MAEKKHEGVIIPFKCQIGRLQNYIWKISKKYYILGISYWEFKEQRTDGVNPDKMAYYRAVFQFT